MVLLFFYRNTLQNMPNGQKYPNKLTKDSPGEAPVKVDLLAFIYIWMEDSG